MSSVPPAHSAPAARPAHPASPSKLPRYLLIGCGSVLFIAILGGIATYVLLRGALTQIAENLTSERPLVIDEVRLSPEELAALDKRIRDFGDALQSGAPTPPLVLTSDEINAQIQKRFQSKPSGAAAVVRIIGRQLEGEVSFPVRGLMPEFEGRYLNGKAVFSVGVVDGRVVVHLADLRVGDQYIPDRLREGLSRENLLKDIYEEDGDLPRALSRIRSIEIGDDKVILTPAI